MWLCVCVGGGEGGVGCGGVGGSWWWGEWVTLIVHNDFGKFRIFPSL